MLSNLAPSVTRVVIYISRAFCLMDQEKRETARSFKKINNRLGVFTLTFLEENPLTRQTRHTFTRSRANLNGPIRKLFLLFCTETNQRQSCCRDPQSSSSLAVMRRRALGSRLENVNPTFSSSVGNFGRLLSAQISTIV